MASDIKSTGSQQNRGLAELQDDFNQRKRDLVEENERKLQALRESYRQREASIRSSGEASVNHIKKTIDARVESTRHEATARLDREDQQIRQNYQNLKARSIQQSQTLEKDLIDQQNTHERQRAQLREENAEVTRREQERTREFLQDQQKNKNRIASTMAKEIQALQGDNVERIGKAHQKSQAEQRKIESENRRRLEDLRENQSRTYSRAKGEGERRLAAVRGESDARIENERSRSNQTLSQMQEKFRREAVTEQREGEKRVSKIDIDNRRRMEQKTRDAIETEDKLERQYQGEIQRVQNEGEQDLKTRKTDFAVRLQKQDDQQRSEWVEKERLFGAKLKEQRTAFEKKAQADGTLYDNNLNELRKDFTQKYNHTSQVQRDSFAHQNEQYLKELYELRAKYQKKIGNIETRKEDPFYATRDFDARLNETTEAYILTAKVPSYERNLVDVRVKEDKIILSAKRSNEAQSDKEGVKTSTNSYQTFRQEFHLPQPVSERKLDKRIHDDGLIEVIIPKRGISTQA